MIGVGQLVIPDPARGDGHDAEGVPGDCWRACVASILELPAERVPHFVAEPGEGQWWYSTHEFLELGGAVIGYQEPVYPLANEFTIATGPSPRGDFHHAVIVHRGGTLAHDPHPSRSGLVSVTAVFPITLGAA